MIWNHKSERGEAESIISFNSQIQEVVRFETLDKIYSPVVDLKVALQQYLEIVLWIISSQLYSNMPYVSAHAYQNCGSWNLQVQHK